MNQYISKYILIGRYDIYIRLFFLNQYILSKYILIGRYDTYIRLFFFARASDRFALMSVHRTFTGRGAS